MSAYGPRLTSGFLYIRVAGRFPWDGWMDGWITENILSLPRAKFLRREKGLERRQKNTELGG